MNKLATFGLEGKKTGKHSFDVYDIKSDLDSLAGVYVVTR